MTYASAARPYTAAGWATLPLPPGKKYPPPSGYTGYAGRPPTLDEIERWIADPATADGNIALRLPGDVVALDIDDHDGDHAGPDTLASLETERGALPATWVSTARGDDDGPGATGHRFYRVPMGTRLRTGAGAGVDIIQRHHRYAVVAPSVHPEGTTYRWYEPSGEPSDRPPRIDELPELPWAWVAALGAPAKAEGTRVDAVAPEAVGAFVAANTEASSPSALRGLRSTLDRMRSKGKGRHDTLVAGACMAAREAAAGRYSAGSGFEELRGWWSDVMSAEPRRRDGTEFGDAIAWGVAQAKADPARVAAIAGADAESARGVDLADVVDPRPPGVHTEAGDLAAGLAAAASGATACERYASARLTLGDPDWWDHEDEARFVCDPLIPEGRHVSIVAEAKAGKSLLGLYVAAGLASGRGALNTPAGEPVRVVYVDMEMTQADARERLRSMGYGPGDDLDALAYYSLPDLGGLDTASGGGDLVELARDHDAALVVIDTMVASLAGAENDAETIREFGRHTIAALKRDGRAVVRLDHLGKDTTRGARGSSAKAGDVDVEWTLTARAGGVQLTATRRRIPWVPEVVELTRDDDPLGYRTTAGRSWPEGTAECAADLDRLGVPVDIGGNAAMRELTNAGVGRSRATVLAAVKYRKTLSTGVSTTLGDCLSTGASTTTAKPLNSGPVPVPVPPSTTSNAHPVPPVLPIGSTGGEGRDLVDYQRPKKGALLGPVPEDPWTPGQALADDDCRDYPDDLGEPVSAAAGLLPLV